MLDDTNYPPVDINAVAQPYQVAVIDVGTTSLRMEVAEIHPDGKIRKLASYSQAVSLGKDAFSKRRIGKRTIEDCVDVLQIYKRQLTEMGIQSALRIRVIATSAVSESNNRLAMLDRIYVATGLEVELIDDAELHRVTYLGVLPSITSHEKRFSGLSAVCEVGGGATEFLLLDRKDVVASRSLRHGSLRLRQLLESIDAPRNKTREMLDAQIESVSSDIIRIIKPEIELQEITSYVAMGGDVRFAAKKIKHKRIDDRLLKVDATELEKFVEEIVDLSDDQLSNRFHISLPDASALAPALMSHLTIAKRLGAKKFFIAEANVRDGLITEMAQGRQWSESIQKQIVRSAQQLGRKYHFREGHARQVAKLSVELFDELALIHQLQQRYRGILEIAATLHEIGTCVATRSYHKHTMYLIRNSELFGIGAQELALVALVARYHRRAVPQPSHEGYSQLSRADRVAVSKLAALLRVAKSLDQPRKQQIKNLEARIEGDRVVITCNGLSDVSIERVELKEKGRFFEEIFGKRIHLITAGDSSLTPKIVN